MNPLLTACMSYLLNSLWQLPLLFAAAWLIDSALTRSRQAVSAALLYRLWTSTLFAAVLLPAISPELFRWLLMLWSSEPVGTISAIAPRHLAPISGEPGFVLPHTAAVVLLSLWGLSLLYFALRLVLGSLRVARLRRAAAPLPAEHPVAQHFAALLQRAGKGHAALAFSAQVGTPVAVGVWRSALLLPTSLCERLDTRELETLLAHEAAHLVRHDVARNLWHRFLALPIMWHPATHTLLGRIAVAREMVCDEQAARQLRSRQQYAHALLRLASALVERHTLPSSHAIGFASANTLERRLMQLTTRKHLPGTALKATRLASILLAGALTCASAVAMHLQASSQPAPTVSADALSGSIVSRVNPVYPKDARAKHIEGTVVIKARIGKDGHISKAEVVDGPPELRQSALNSVRTWVYKPYRINGQPTAVDTTINVNYHAE